MGVVSTKWLGQRQPPTGPQGAPSGLSEVQVGALQAPQTTAAGGVEEINDTQLRFDGINENTFINFQGYIGGGVVSAASPTPIARLRLQEYDSNDVLLNATYLQNSQMQSPPVAGGNQQALPTGGVYDGANATANTSYITVHIEAGAPGEPDGQWALSPVSLGGAVLTGSRIQG